jgi:hypothetical protein
MSRRSPKVHATDADAITPDAPIDLRADFACAGFDSYLAALEQDLVGLKPVTVKEPVAREALGLIAPADILSSRVFTEAAVHNA